MWMDSPPVVSEDPRDWTVQYILKNSHGPSFSCSSGLAPSGIPKSQRPQDGQHPQVSPIFLFVAMATDIAAFLELAEPVR